MSCPLLRAKCIIGKTGQELRSCLRDWPAFVKECLLMTAVVVELRIHDYTERGDNDTVKNGSKGMGAALVGGCCGGGAIAR